MEFAFLADFIRLPDEGVRTIKPIKRFQFIALGASLKPTANSAVLHKPSADIC
jgi:hypothetical protein